MLKLIHGADFHLDAPFAALSTDKARQRRAEQRQLLVRLADLVEEEQAQLVLLAGDLLDGGQTYQETVELLAHALGQLKVPVFIAPGNHDCYGPRSVYAGTFWPDNVHIFSSVGIESVELPQLNCVVHGAAFTTPQADRSPLMGFTAPADGRRHLMVLHGDVDGKGRYGPIAPADIAASNLDYLERMFAPELRGKYALWYARYASAPGETGIGMWQYRDNGRVDGIRGNVDMDIAYKDFARVISEEGLNHLERPESTPDSATPEPNDVIRYVVKKGDTLSAIAKQHGITLQRLISYNHVTDPDRIYPGEVIDIPHGENVSAMRFYTVKPGDTLSGIAKKHQTTVKKLQQLNKIKDPDQIYPGQIIQIR